MKLKLEHRFACDPATYWEIATDDAVEAEGAGKNNGEVETLSDTIVNGVRTRRQRFTMNRDLPAAITKVLKTDRISYELELRIDEKRHRAEWTITPRVLPDRVKGSGVAVVTPTSDGCLRVIDGELTVKVPLVGRMMEERLIAEVTASYNVTAGIIRQKIAERSA